MFNRKKKRVKNVIFHLGLPKCASSYLQRCVFPEIPGVINHAKQPAYNAAEKGSFSGDKRIETSPLARNLYEVIGSGRTNDIASFRDKVSSEAERGRVVFSDEAITSFRFSKTPIENRLECCRQVCADVSVQYVVVGKSLPAMIRSLYLDSPVTRTSTEWNLDEFAREVLRDQEFRFPLQAIHYLELLKKEDDLILLDSENWDYARMSSVLGIEKEHLKSLSVAKENQSANDFHKVLRHTHSNLKKNSIYKAAFRRMPRTIVEKFGAVAKQINVREEYFNDETMSEITAWNEKNYTL